MIERLQWPSAFEASEFSLVGVSGGRDSVALLDLLVRSGLNNLIICHLNHQLRGNESDGDEDFVRQLANQYQLPIETSSMPVSQLAQQEKISLELAARHTRYQFFASCAAKHGANQLILGHHADDQAETILYNLMRGSAGLRGMSASSSTQQYGELTILRPMLDISREEIDQYIKKHHLPYREDSSNAEDFAVRNRIRNELMPLAKEIMGRDPRRSIIRAESMAVANQSWIDQHIQSLEIEDPQGRLFLPKLQQLDLPLLKRAIYLYLKKHQVAELNAKKIDECLQLVDPSQASKVNLSKGQFLRRKEKRLFIQASTD
ncbi:tRNA lysidine(34) synthetase TilS [Persicirhabdus sediminis]|uniref:tRNA(Ile)-lysidine synthase n=1 Tax=Persicirhabdus sediminis TaxID=454144 RepID=A0A8J7MFC6_9BACT|nr:tRNA lysidine(34) synthetase TilS [Persicirhabdus sediminis]MBK1790774.1 tRNA lysidine(34) synthetase TilS [Persicirhabdus sediminis]